VLDAARPVDEIKAAVTGRVTGLLAEDGGQPAGAAAGPAAAGGSSPAAEPAGRSDVAIDEVSTVEPPLDVLDDMLGIGDQEPSGPDERELGQRYR
jgi:hypothetical protein